ncbi:unnamed protein product [Amoebophrya sp. A25]|nr:unnamed protein product [Amoebophrya sp. A25]|eukprot:GSA25T00011451001.1
MVFGQQLRRNSGSPYEGVPSQLTRGRVVFSTLAALCYGAEQLLLTLQRTMKIILFTILYSVASISLKNKEYGAF